MSNVFKVRTASLTNDGRRTSLKFDETTWKMIDHIAEKRGTGWKEWARQLFRANPDAPNKAAVLRAALAEELVSEQFKAANEIGEVEVNTPHEIIGSGYWRLNDEQLKSELEGAVITIRDNSFTAFTFIMGYRNKSAGGEPFVIVQNELRDGLHLMIAPTVD